MFARQILDHQGGTFVGALRRSQPGVDGTLNGLPVALKETEGGLAAVLRHASVAEKQIVKAGHHGVDVYIKAPNVAKDALTDFVRNGPLGMIPRQGTVTGVHVLTRDGWVVIR